jgi:hypothetical protein
MVSLKGSGVVGLAVWGTGEGRERLVVGSVAAGSLSSAGEGGEETGAWRLDSFRLRGFVVEDVDCETCSVPDLVLRFNGVDSSSGLKSSAPSDS